MTFAELDIAPRTKGRVAKALRLEPAGELCPADLALLASERGIKPTELLVLRERHHALAKLLAAGYSNNDCSQLTGYDPSRISILKSQPLFQQMIQDYKDQSSGVAADFVERANTLALTVVSRLQEAVEDRDDISTGTLLEIGKYAADRSNNGPTTRTQNVNVNVNLGDRLRTARERANAAMKQGTPPSTVPIPALPDEPLLDVTPRIVNQG